MKLYLFLHPLYSKNLAPSNYHRFAKLKEALCKRRFASDDKVKDTIHRRQRSQPKTFFTNGIRRLVNHCTICLEKRGAYVENWHTWNLSQIVIHTVINKFTLLFDFVSYLPFPWFGNRKRNEWLLSIFKIMCIWNSKKHRKKACGLANNSIGNMCLKKWKSGGTAISTGVCKFQLPGHHGDYILHVSVYYLWNLSVELLFCHSSGIWNFEVAPRHFEKLAHPSISTWNEF